jgi:hypothetical protein
MDSSVAKIIEPLFANNRYSFCLKTEVSSITKSHLSILLFLSLFKISTLNLLHKYLLALVAVMLSVAFPQTRFLLPSAGSTVFILLTAFELMIIDSNVTRIK